MVRMERVVAGIHFSLFRPGPRSNGASSGIPRSRFAPAQLRAELQDLPGGTQWSPRWLLRTCHVTTGNSPVQIWAVTAFDDRRCEHRPDLEGDDMMWPCVVAYGRCGGRATVCSRAGVVVVQEMVQRCA
jgi:hypothetical protein